MKPRIQPTQREIPVGDSDMIITKTDLTGRITYANRVFMRISNFAERDLLGVQHNLVRHPDMPRGVYRLMWDTLKAGNEFFGVVKNMSADGHYYWVFANVTVDFDSRGQAIGYFSVRRQAPKDAIREATALYEQMLRIEQQAGPATAPEASVKWLTGHFAALDTTYERYVVAQYQNQK